MDLKTLCFIPCCGGKIATLTAEPNHELWYNKINIDSSALLRGRKEMAYSLIPSNPTKAIDLYTGNFYQPLNKKLIITEINLGNLHLFIISAGYGLVDANELIYDYNAEMKGQTAQMWRDIGLVEFIANVIQVIKADRVFGFFSGSSQWSSTNSNYRYFFSEGLKSAISSGYSLIQAGCFHRSFGRGSAIIPKTLGYCFRDAFQENFSKNYLLKMRDNTLPYPGSSVVVKYEPFIKLVS